MKRVDYLRARRSGAVLTVLRDPRVLDACRMGGIVLVVIGGVAAVEATRVAFAQAEYDDVAARVALLDAGTAAIKALARDVARLDAVAIGVERRRTSAIAAASEVARIGNLLPRDIWLASLRFDPQSVALEGHGARLDAVVPMLTKLVTKPGADARIVNLNADPARGGVAYAIAVRGSR